MNDVWNLDSMYLGFDDPSFAADLAKLKETVAGLAQFVDSLATADPLEGLKMGIDLEEKIYLLAGPLIDFSMLRQAADTRDNEANSRLGQIFGIFSETAGPQAKFQEWASKLPNLMELVAGDEVLREYTFLFENIRTNSRYLLPGMGEEIMARMKLSGGNAWTELQQTLTSTVPVMYRGGKTNLSAIRNLAYDPDPAVRKDAYEAELACYERIEDAVAYAMNSIKLETIHDCELRGHAGPLERTLLESHMSKATLDAMMEAIEEYLPAFRRYLKAKGKALGHENGLPWYDLFAPMGTMAEKYTAQQARDYLVELFAGFDGELSDLVARAFDEAWIDFYPRDGKSGGAFCSEITGKNESRILTNFDGLFGDIVTLAHELGHAFHNQCVENHRVLNHDYSMPVAETASTFNECVVMNAAIAAAKDPGEKLALLESMLQDVTQVIVDIASRYRFETMVLEKRSEEFLSAQALCELMTEAQKYSYGDGLNVEQMHPYMWICKSHYYGATFYNFPYSFGALFARGLYAQYVRDGEAFVPKYKKLLYTTAVATAEDTAKTADIDLTDKNFWRSALQQIADEIDLFCQLVEQ